MRIGKFDENVFASYLLYDQLYICSDHSTKAMRNVTNENGTRFLNLYSISIENEKIKSKPVELSGGINTKLNQGPIFIDPQNNNAYYSNNLSQNDSSDYRVELFVADFQSGVFSNAKPIGIVGKEFNSAHPIIIDNGTQMIFASDLNGEFSQSDLFISNWDQDHWSEPKVIPLINSSKTETFPTFFNNTLYFSSDRGDGFGGLDLYKSEYANGEFQKPEILLDPFNSEFDDFLYISKNSSSGYFSSNRKGGFDRVFYYQYKVPTSDKFEEQTTSFCYIFSDEESENNDSLVYTWYFGNGKTAVGNTVEYCYEELGDYNVYCDILDTRNNKIVEKAATYNIGIQTDKPLIQWSKSETENQLSIFVQQKFSKEEYSQWYWILNEEFIFETSLVLDLNKYDTIDVKLVCYDSKDNLPIIGLHKKLR